MRNATGGGLEHALTGKEGSDQIYIRGQEPGLISLPNPLEAHGGGRDEYDHRQYDFIHLSSVTEEHDGQPASYDEYGRIDPEPLGNGLELLESGNG